MLMRVGRKKQLRLWERPVSLSHSFLSGQVCLCAFSIRDFGRLSRVFSEEAEPVQFSPLRWNQFVKQNPALAKIC